MDLIGADLKKLYSSLPWLMDGVLQFSMPNHQKAPIHHNTIQLSGGDIEHEVQILGKGGEDESRIGQLQKAFASMMLRSARTVARTSQRDHAAIQEELKRNFTEQVEAAMQKYLIELDRLEKRLKATDQSHTNEQRKLRDRLRQEEKAHGRYFQDVEKGVSEATVHVRGQLAAAKAETALYKKASSEKQQLQDQVSRLEHEMAQIRTAKSQREADLKALEDEAKAVREGYDQLKVRRKCLLSSSCCKSPVKLARSLLKSRIMPYEPAQLSTKLLLRLTSTRANYNI
jgi:chromosome segregation ATPase